MFIFIFTKGSLKIVLFSSYTEAVDRVCNIIFVIVLYSFRKIVKRLFFVTSIILRVVAPIFFPP